MDERAMVDALDELFELAFEGDIEGDTPLELAGCQVQTFKDAGVLTDNQGLVVRLPDGSEFQISVIKVPRRY